MFSEAAGRHIETVDDLAQALSDGDIDVSQVTIKYIVTEDGHTLILNTRSSQALIKAGISRNLWNAENVTGDAFFENALENQLTRNGLTTAGISEVYCK
jgi:hypothetical protein